MFRDQRRSPHGSSPTNPMMTNSETRKAAIEGPLDRRIAEGVGMRRSFSVVAAPLPAASIAQAESDEPIVNTRTASGHRRYRTPTNRACRELPKSPRWQNLLSLETTNSASGSVSGSFGSIQARRKREGRDRHDGSRRSSLSHQAGADREKTC